MALLDKFLVPFGSKFLSSKTISKYFPSGVRQGKVASCKENLHFNAYIVFSENFIFFLVCI
jgi:hypothetical protein